MFEPKKSVIERYGSLEFSPHEAFSKIIPIISKSWNVLDVGCGTGRLGKWLREKLDCYVVGIEVDQEAAKIAEKFYDKVIISDVEQLKESKFPQNFFDAIVMADVLEHLKRPDILLIKLKPSLKTEGYVIASVPNISRLEIRIQLLFGKFTYEETGILDKTHLRFFTLNTAKELFQKAGYEIARVDFTGLRSKHSPFRRFPGARARLLRLFPTLLAYQFIIIARPK